MKKESLRDNPAPFRTSVHQLLYRAGIIDRLSISEKLLNLTVSDTSPPTESHQTSLIGLAMWKPIPYKGPLGSTNLSLLRAAIGLFFIC